MKTRILRGLKVPHALVLTLAAGLGSPTVHATDGTWNTTANNSLWGTPGNWLAGIASGSGATARFDTLDLTADTTVRLEVSRTIGKLIFGDTDPATAFGWTLDNNGGTGNILTLADTTPTITVNALGGDSSVTLSSVIAGSSGLTKDGAGTLTLSGTANTYTGRTVIAGGTLAIAADRSLGAVPGAFQQDSIFIINGGTLRQMTGPWNFTLDAKRGITLGSGVQTIWHNGYGYLRINGIISGSGGVDVRSDDGNDLRFGGINTYTGETRLYSNLGMSIARCLEGTTLDYDNYGGQLNYITSFTAVTFGGLKGAQSLIIGTVALSVGNNNADTAYSGELSGTGGSLTKIGTGTLTLGGNNSYTGATNVKDGTLVLNGSNTGTLDLTVSTGARLGGNGSTTAAVTVQSGGKLLVDISNWAGVAGTGFSDLAAASLNLTGASWTLDVKSATAYANFTDATKAFRFLVAPGGISGFNAANVSITAAGFTGPGTWSVRQSADTHALELVYTASGLANPYDNWAISKGLDGTVGREKGVADDPDNDGHNNLAEFAFNGDPLNGSDNGQIYVLRADSSADSPDTNKELILTLAVRKDTDAFTAGAPATANCTADGIAYAIEGSLNLAIFDVTVTPVGFVDPGVALTDATHYEFRSFSLNGSNGLPGKGFLRAKIVK